MRDPVEVFQSLAIQRGGLLFFKPNDAIKVIGNLETIKMRILGLDAFIVTSETTQPIMEHSMDFSGMEDAWEAAKKFLETKMQSDFVFEIILDN